MKAATAAQLSNGAWPLLQSLTLARGRKFGDLSTCSADVFRQFKGKWPLLKSLTVSMHRMDTAEVTALTETDWPLLRTLCIEPLDDAIPALMKGNWPELKNLSVGNEMTGGLEYLADIPWSMLQRLRVNFAQVTPSGMYSLIHAHLPKLQELCFVNTIWYTEGKDLAITLPCSTNSLFALPKDANELCSEVLVHKQAQFKWRQANISLINSHS